MAAAAMTPLSLETAFNPLNLPGVSFTFLRLLQLSDVGTGELPPELLAARARTSVRSIPRSAGVRPVGCSPQLRHDHYNFTPAAASTSRCRMTSSATPLRA